MSRAVQFIQHSWLLLSLTLAAFITHFWRLSQPPEVVFDEVHFGKFINGYFTGNYFFDIHPPLGKLIIFFFGKFGGFKPGFGFSNIGDAYGDTNYEILRFAPALFGALLIPLIYLIIRRFGASRFAAGLGGAFALFDTAILTESRLILLDGILLFFIALALYLYLKTLGSKMYSLRWFLWVAATGIAMGLAMSVKWTALGIIAALCIAYLIEIFATSVSPANIYRGVISGFLLLCILPMMVYFFGFALHFKLLPLSGPGDAFMTPEFQSALIGSTVQSDKPKPDLIQKTLELNITMYTANAGITADHNWKSRWWSWPIMMRGVSYWIKTFQDGRTARITLLGNPFVWWGALVGILAYCASLGIAILHRTFWSALKNRNSAVFRTTCALFAGFLLSWLPFIPVKRVLFLYHYHPSLLVSIIITALVFDSLLGENRKKYLYFTALCIVLAIGFYLFSPLSYGLPLSDSAYHYRLWFPSWQ